MGIERLLPHDTSVFLFKPVKQTGLPQGVMTFFVDQRCRRTLKGLLWDKQLDEAAKWRVFGKPCAWILL